MSRPPFKLSFQLYSARESPSQDLVLDGLAEIGYDAVEAWLPDYGDDPKSFRKRLDDAGLVCLGFHMPLKGLVDETNRFIDVALTIGDKPLMIPPYIATQERPDDIDGWKRIGEMLARGAERVRSNGLKVAWHNHEFEYRLLADGTRPIDHILGAAGDAVGFEIDLAWVTRGWADPVSELKKFAPRIVAIQLKDTAPPGTLDSENGWRATGDGIVDWETLWPLFSRTQADHLVVEHDRPTDWRLTAKRSYDFARSKGLAR